MTRRPERVEYDRAHAELRARLRRWDPAAHAPEDEYDCLIPGLYLRLRAGGGEEELTAFLSREVAEHFGMSPRPAEDRQVARELVSWWREPRL